MKFDHFTPTLLCFGEGRLAEAGVQARRLGGHALVVTSRRAMDRLGYAQRLIQDLIRNGLKTTVYQDIGPGVPLADVDRGAELARRAGVDCVVALGGGTVLDGAKAIAGVAAADRPAADFLHQRAQVGSEALPLLAIPTTSGTGSEVNRSCIVTDPSRRMKDGIRSDHLFPRCAIVDPLLTVDLPPEVTAATGFDALAHAVESYVSPRAQPVADERALSAIRSVALALPRALADPRNGEARFRLSLASTTMGWNLSCVGTCFPHRIDKALCAFHPDICHGQSLAYFYPHWAEMSWRGAPERFARVAEMLDAELVGRPVEEQAAACPRTLAQFLRGVGLGGKLRDSGVRADELPALAAHVAGDLSVNPVPFSKADVPGILEAVFAS